MNTPKELLTLLEEKCLECDGKGGSLSDPESRGWADCEKCNGTGFIPTDIGSAVLALVRRKTRLTVNAELSISSGR